MDERLSYFAYSPPKSNSHGHASRDKNLQRATQKVIDSAVSLFNATCDEKLSLTLRYDKKTELEKAHKTINKLTAFLGPQHSEWDNADFEFIENSVSWKSKTQSILDLIAYANTIQDDNYLPLSKYWISTFYHYGKQDEPHGHMMICIEMGRLFTRLSLIIPHTVDDEKSYELIARLQKLLPFKLNSKHFRRLGPSKWGYGQWKLDTETQNKLERCLKG